MDEDERMRKGAGKRGGRTEKARPAKQQEAPISSQSLTMNGGSIAGVGAIGPGSTVNIYNQQISPHPSENLSGDTNLVRREALTTPDMKAHELSDPFEAWIDQSKERWNELAATVPDGLKARFNRGCYIIAFQIRDKFPKINLIDLPGRIRAAEAYLTSETGFSAGEDVLKVKLYALNDTAEFWTGAQETSEFNVPLRGDFWRISLDGSAFRICGYSEDRQYRQPPEKLLYLDRVVLRAADGVHHTARLARQLGAPEARISFSMICTGLAGRKLSRPPHDERVDDYKASRQDEIRLDVEYGVQEVEERLTEIVQELLEPLGALFNFKKIGPDDIQPRVDDMFERERIAKAGGQMPKRPSGAAS